MGACPPSNPGSVTKGQRGWKSKFLAVTMLVAAGAETDIPKGLPGLNLMPLIAECEKLDRDAIYGESFAHDIAYLKNPEASLLYR